MRLGTTSSSVSSRVVMTEPTFLIEKFPLLKPQHLWPQQSQNFPSVTMSKHEDALPFASSFDLFLSLRQILQNLEISTKNKNFYQFYRPTIHQAVNTRSQQNNKNAVKHTQIVAYDICISVIVMQCFWRK